MATFTTSSGRNGNQIVAGVGWKAVFRGGRFTTHDEVTANGLRRYSARHPEYGISEVDDEMVEQAAEPWEPTGELAQEPDPPARRRRRPAADPARDDPGLFRGQTYSVGPAIEEQTVAEQLAIDAEESS